MTDRSGPEADLAIVSSPLQYMNAVEQRRTAGGRPCDLLLIGDRHGAGETIAALMRRRNPWRAVVRHGRRPRPHRFAPLVLRDLFDAAHRASLRRLAAGLPSGSYGAVLIGDYRNVSHRFVAELIAHDELVLVDDGSVTPQVAWWRADADRAAEPKQFDLSWFRTGLARRLFGDPSAPEPARLTFHTIYGPLMGGRLAPGDRLVTHAYDAWRGGAADSARGDEVWFLGSDHAEAGICAEADYRDVVAGAAAALRAEGYETIIYRPHRGERADKVMRSAAEAGLAVAVGGAPVELDYLDAPVRPGLVVAIASSAVDTLSVLDPMLPLARIAVPAHYLRKRADHIRAVIAVHDAFVPRLRVIAPRARG